MKFKLNDVHFQLLLALIVVVGYFPVSFQLLTLKNDIIQLDLPVKYFISQELHRGQLPLWMYSWGGGFPLGHLFTWSAYNPISLVLCGIFNYNITLLHFEFLLYMIMGALGLFRICRKILAIDARTSLIVAGVYALSEITVSCAQFLAYVAAIGILPWVVYFFLRLLQEPKWYQACLLAFSAFCLVSWTYPAAAFITIYLLALILGVHFWRNGKRVSIPKTLSMLALAMLLLLLLAAPLLYMTYYTLPVFKRSGPVADNNFGYLYFSTLLTFFYPFFSIGKSYPGSTFLFQNVFVGVIALPVAIWGVTFGRRHLPSRLYLLGVIGAFFTLWLALGDLALLKKIADACVPGWKWFRFPSFFRIFFLFSFCIWLGLVLAALQKKSKVAGPMDSMLKKFILVFLTIGAGIGLFKLVQLPILNSGFDPGTMDTSSWFILGVQAISFAWILMLLVCVLLGKMHLKDLGTWLLLDMLIIALFSLPVYAVSTYTKKDLAHILFTEKQERVAVDNNLVSFVDQKGNSFNGLSVYQNKVSVAPQYLGPLYLTSLNSLQESAIGKVRSSAVIFTGQGAAFDQKNIQAENDSFNNHQFSARVRLESPVHVFAYQLWHPLWTAYIDGTPQAARQSAEGLVYVSVPKGIHSVSFVFGSQTLTWLSWLHYLVLGTLVLIICAYKLRGYV